MVYFRPRSTLSAFWTQYYRYARGDGKADLFRKRHALRYFVYGVVFPALLGHAVWGFFARWLGWLGLVAGFVAYCWRPWQRLGVVGRGLTVRQRVLAALWVPIIRAVGDVAKMVGYPVGRVWRMRHRAKIAQAEAQAVQLSASSASLPALSPPSLSPLPPSSISAEQ